MGIPKTKDTALLVHIEHTNPIEVKDLVTSLNALNNLYNTYVRENAQCSEMSKSKLYVEKIKECCIDIYLCELASASLIPFMENINVIFEFSSYIKKVYDFFVRGKGDRPKLSVQDCDNFKNVLNVVANAPGNTMSIGVIDKSNLTINNYNNCTFDFGDGNGAQKLLEKEAEDIATEQPDKDVHKRVLMQIYQTRNETESNTGNKAIVDEIFKGKKIGVVFETDELKKKILFSDTNPNRTGYWVDIEVHTVNGKPKAYNVLELHDTIDLDE